MRAPLVNESLVLAPTTAKVEQEADLHLARLEVIEKLRHVFLGQGLSGLQLHNNFLFHDQVRNVVPDRLTVVDDLKGNLLLNRHVSVAQLDFHCVLVHLLQKAISELAVDVESRSQYLLGNLAMREVPV